ncbi:methyltransferase domain-containing protein [Paenibacillus sp. HJL G12]|uniref:Methyltransferase domain-containing protein n=1 Tax=Paenibacillus dendrobii TaxID=2691084 RepID=A0A7X3IGC3_9BACL|nr:class I SAM-dependent methyltransferase [Paenibacillus dendrobii]MWV43033.1 methyltransferase domain-containing protein [Paenibacillus dendrobii]
MNKQKLIKKFDKQSAKYEESTRKRMLGVWRNRLLQGVQGDVLEIAVGAGANFHIYDMDKVRLTAADFSPMMLQRARRLAEEMHFQVHFIECDIEALDFPEHSFDCVVSTLSLCGYEDPEMVLRNISKWCKPGGRVFLLEHGLGKNPLLKSAQRLLNPVARKMSGCHWDRNIEQIVQRSELKIERIERYWNGMVHLIWARS